MADSADNFCNPNFSPVPLRGNASWTALAASGLSDLLARAAEHAPRGNCVFWGLPFKIGARPVVVCEGQKPVARKLPSVRAQWLVFAHACDIRELDRDAKGFIRSSRGVGMLGEHAADYVMVYADGTEERAAIRRRHHIGAPQRIWGENCVQTVACGKPMAVRAHDRPPSEWGQSQFRVSANDNAPWVHWLWAWENPNPRKPLVEVRFEPVSGAVVVAGITSGRASECPLRWRSRRKATLTLPRGEELDPALDGCGCLSQIRIDMGAVISAVSRPVYPNDKWGKTCNNALPQVSSREVLVEYACHPDARFYLPGGRVVPAARLEEKGKAGALRVVAPSTQQVALRVVEKGSSKPVAVKLHVHGDGGEYLAPMDRHREVNPGCFEDYSTDFAHNGIHLCTYIPGETRMKLPLGKVYLEVSKGFEIRPVRKVVRVTRATREITIELEKVLPWREQDWVSADTHVHFLSPTTGLLEGSGEGVNVVNLLDTQLGELMTNTGDLDGKTTHGSVEAGGDGEYLLRVGSENRHHVLGHISLVGYNGPAITPFCSGGPDESALGDPIEVLLTEWAQQCRRQDGIVVLPHFPNPRMEHAATIVHGDADAVEMTSWGNLYAGIDPYSLSDWYRYLNNGYLAAAVGGTDKMSATTAVGTVRTYARIARQRKFTYDAWKEAIRRAETFVTYGPLLELEVDGRPMGSRIAMSRRGGTVDVTWKVASVTIPMTSVELIANGEVIDGRVVDPESDQGHFSVKVDKCTWLALLVRGHYADKPEIIAAHSSPVMIDVAGTEFYSAADAMTILEQIEGALAYLDTVGTRAETKAYKRMRMVLTSAHRKLHNRMHRSGVFHEHSATTNHPEHRG